MTGKCPIAILTPTFLSPADVIQLQDADLLHPSTSLAKAIKFENHNAYFAHQDYMLRITSLDNNGISIPVTRSGREIFQVLGGDICTEYLRSFSKFLYKA